MKLRSPKSDPQIAALVELEKEFSGSADGHVASERHLRKIAREVCDYYGLRVVPLRFVHRSKLKFWAWIDHTVGKEDHEIFLHQSAFGQNALTLLHELAHYVSDCCYEDHESHGKEFCAIYMHLLHRWKILPQDAFRVMARRWGLKIAREYLPTAIATNR